MTTLEIIMIIFVWFMAGFIWGIGIGIYVAQRWLPKLGV